MSSFNTQIAENQNYLNNLLDEHGLTMFKEDFFSSSSKIGALFHIWSASSHPNTHHYGQGGLITHTVEVIKLCLANKRLLNIEIDEKQIILAGLYHDVGKLWDYISVPDTNYQEWTKTDHKYKIHHISRSALVWSESAARLKANAQFLTDEFIDNVLHAILAHHGLQEWGSPVSPRTKLAWLLHLCDGISARIEDCDRRELSYTP